AIVNAGSPDTASRSTSIPASSVGSASSSRDSSAMVITTALSTIRYDVQQGSISVNPLLSSLQPYPFEKLRALFAGVTPPAAAAPIALSLGEPQRATPALIRDALIGHLDGLSSYPTTAGLDHLREAIAAWFRRRYQ